MPLSWISGHTGRFLTAFSVFQDLKAVCVHLSIPKIKINSQISCNLEAHLANFQATSQESSELIT